jgi:hypothetical protein
VVNRPLDDVIREARLLAMAAVLNPDGEAWLRGVCRWYAGACCTPLHVVEAEIPMEKVLEAYFEAKYAQMEDEERDIEIHEIMMTAEERKQKKVEAAVAAEADDEFFNETVAEAERAKIKNPSLAQNKKLTEEERSMQIPLIPVMGSHQPLNEQSMSRPQGLTEIPPDIKMVFSDDLDEFDDWDLLGPTEPEKK